MKRLRRLGGIITAATLLLASATALADGTEELGAPSILLAEGSGFSTGGTGLFQFVDENTFVQTDGDIVVSVPPGAQVKQVLLYWVSEYYPQTGPDTDLGVNGALVTGTSIGGPTNFFSVIEYEAFRADITGLGVVQPGNNVLEITDADSSYRTTGAGVVVVYDDGTGADLQLRDGLDLAYWRFTDNPPLDVTEPQTFTFDPEPVDRVARMPFQVGSVGDARPNVTAVTIDGETTYYYNLFTSLDGPEWDSQLIEFDIPAGVSELTVELISASDGTNRNPASIGWVAGGLAISEPDNPPVPCDDCDGQVDTLNLQYNGDDHAFVQVQQKVQGRERHAWAFEGTVQPGDTFGFVGLNNQGTLGPEIEIYVDGRRHTKIHTSCSQPIGPGLISGDFEVIRGTSRNGGELCPIDTPPPPPPGDDDCECDGKVTELTLKYTGTETNALVQVEQKKTESNNQYVFEGVVNPGDTFSFSGEDKHGTLSTEITIYVNGDANTEIHTSCSQPIGPGLQSGDFLVVEGRSRNGGDLCPLNPPPPPPPGDDDCECDGKVTELTLKYTGAGTDALVQVEQKKTESDNDYVFEGTVNPGDTFSFSGEDKHGTLSTEITIHVNGIEHTNIHTSCSQPIGPGLQSGQFLVVAGRSRNGGDLCPLDGGGDPSEVDTYCDAGKPVALTLQYTGAGCAATDHSQDAGKVTCDGDPAGAASVRIVVSDRDDPAHHQARIYFDGEVALGDELVANARDADMTRMRSNTYAFIYDLNGTLLQTLAFHTSCSQPLNPDDQFGALRLVGFETMDGPVQVTSNQVDGSDGKVPGCGAGSAGTTGSSGDWLLLVGAGIVLAVAMKRRRHALV